MTSDLSSLLTSSKNLTSHLSRPDLPSVNLSLDQIEALSCRLISHQPGTSNDTHLFFSITNHSNDSKFQRQMTRLVSRAVWWFFFFCFFVFMVLNSTRLLMFIYRLPLPQHHFDYHHYHDCHLNIQPYHPLQSSIE